jgi:hypothetical protein
MRNYGWLTLKVTDGELLEIVNALRERAALLADMESSVLSDQAPKLTALADRLLAGRDANQRS